MACLLVAHPALADELIKPKAAEHQDNKDARERLTDAAIIVLIIAASIATYKAMGKPCACPSDTMRNGRACGGNSAYMRPGGFKPLCFAKDITPAMIAAYRATKAIPGLR